VQPSASAAAVTSRTAAPISGSRSSGRTRKCKLPGLPPVVMPGSHEDDPQFADTHHAERRVRSGRTLAEPICSLRAARTDQRCRNSESVAPVPRMFADISQWIRARRLCCSARISGGARARAEERGTYGFGGHLSSPGCGGCRKGGSSWLSEAMEREHHSAVTHPG